MAVIYDMPPGWGEEGNAHERIFAAAWESSERTIEAPSALARSLPWDYFAPPPPASTAAWLEGLLSARVLDDSIADEQGVLLGGPPQSTQMAIVWYLCFLRLPRR